MEDMIQPRKRHMRNVLAYCCYDKDTVDKSYMQEKGLLDSHFPVIVPREGNLGQ